MKRIDRHAAWSLATAALFVLGLAVALPGGAQAQTQPPPPTPAQPPTISLAPTQPGDLFSLASLGQSTGQALKNYGIYLNLQYGTEIAGNVAGGREQGWAYTGQASGGLDIDLQQMFGIPNAQFHINFDDRNGRTVNFMAGSQIGLQDFYGPSDSFRLNELSYSQSLFNDHVRFLIGRIYDDVDFLYSDWSCQFINTCGQPSAWYFNVPGMPTFPWGVWGMRITVKPTNPTYIRFGAYEEDPGLNSPFNQGFTWNAATAVGVFIPMEVGYETTLSTARYPSHFAIGGYHSTSTATMPAASAVGAGTPVTGQSAVWLMATQTVWRPNPSIDRSIELFAQAYLAAGGYQEYIDSFNVGAMMRQPFMSRPNDKAGFLVSSYVLNPRIVEYQNSLIKQSGATGTLDATQFNLEAFYNFRIAPGITLRPDAEFVIHPDQLIDDAAGGCTDCGNNPLPNPRIRDAMVISLQLTIDFPAMLGMPELARSH